LSARSFRFGVVAYSAASSDDWSAKARRVEELGYDVLLLPDHPSDLAAFPALAAAASATSSIRLGTLVANNDNRHPVLLAHEAATIDILSGGRLELGIGAGWCQAEYEGHGNAIWTSGDARGQIE
jgi:alkanesulfonate monooxygenase SsuD/methylene tetrahydromethanopterin reductase-like flavin-dependent oxidoreductase (luciferase family)